MTKIKLLSALMIFTSLTSSAGEVTLHLIPAPTRTNWSSPQKLAVSAVVNQVAKYNGGERHEIGHVYVELSCRGTHLFTGSTSDGNSEERKDLFIKGYGLGIVLKNFVGKLDDPQASQSDVASMQATGRSTFVKFLISDQSCDRLMEYWSEYQLRGYHHTYSGLNARPLFGESSGCTAFGMSFLELAGLQIPEFEQSWMTDLIIPRRFVGGPLTGRNIRLVKVLTAFRAKWDSDLSNGGFPLHFWDPEKMVEWTHAAAEELNSGVTRSFPWPASTAKVANSEGLVFDARNVPTPTGPIFRVP